jgi:signal transduction histidine kinase/CheY-like chemotaxis protein
MRCRFANAAHGEWFGRSPDSMLGLSLRELLGDAMFADVEPNMREALKGRSQAFERTVVKPSGEIGHTWAHYVPDIDPDGQTIGLYVLASDVTALKRAEARLRETNLLLEEARDRAEAATVAKSEFLANMSHEIRTPLTAILGFTGLLSDNPQLPETARAHVFRIKGASAGLLSIVNDILDFSTLEARQAVVTPRPVNVIDLARDTLGVFELQAAAKALRLDLDVAPAVPSCVAVDPDRLRQILMNLIGNAVKFTDQGKIGLTLDYQADSQVLHVKVEDSGSGMDEAQRARLFQRFSQVDAPSTRRHGGSGLGLAICKGLTEAMGGQIGVASRPGQGSVFFFHIQAPTSSGPALVQGADRSTPLSGLRVLVADDHPANRELARVLLEQLEAEVTDVKDGAELVREAAERPYDVILADLRMPRLDGRAALRAIRSVPGPNQQAPILAFTADPPGSVDIGPGAFDGVVFKPITPSNLISALIQATQRPPLRRRLG